VDRRVLVVICCGLNGRDHHNGFHIHRLEHFDHIASAPNKSRDKTTELTPSYAAVRAICNSSIIKSLLITATGAGTTLIFHKGLHTRISTSAHVFVGHDGNAMGPEFSKIARQNFGLKGFVDIARICQLTSVIWQ
jgi:hypothetical protein